MRPAFPFIYVHCTNSISHIGQQNVYFGPSNTVIYPPFLRMPYMAVSAYLCVVGWRTALLATSGASRRMTSSACLVVANTRWKAGTLQGPLGAMSSVYQFAVCWSSAVRELRRGGAR